MVIKYESCRIAKIKEDKLKKLLEFINKNISNNGIVYKKKKIKDASNIDLRLFLISKKEFDNRLEIKIAFDTPMNILDYIKYGEEEITLRHSILGRMIIYTDGDNKNYLLVILKKTRSAKVISQLNRLIGEDVIDFINIDLPKTKSKNLTNFWAKDIMDDHERNIAASGVDLEEGSTYKNIQQKGCKFGAVKTKKNKLNYGLSEEGLIWVIPQKELDMDGFLYDMVKALNSQGVLYIS